jgi:hypothetical protein
LLGLPPSWAAPPSSHTVSAGAATGEKIAGTIVVTAETNAGIGAELRLVMTGAGVAGLVALLCRPAGGSIAAVAGPGRGVDGHAAHELIEERCGLC